LPARPPEDLEDAGHHNEVQQRDQIQEARRQERADRPTQRFIGGTGIHNSAEYRPGRDRDAHADSHDHGRMPEGEEESRAQGALAVSHQLAGGVVNTRNMVSVEGVAESEEPRRDGHAEPDSEPA